MPSHLAGTQGEGGGGSVSHRYPLGLATRGAAGRARGQGPPPLASQPPPRGTAGLRLTGRLLAGKTTGGGRPGSKEEGAAFGSRPPAPPRPPSLPQGSFPAARLGGVRPARGGGRGCGDSGDWPGAPPRPARHQLLGIWRLRLWAPLQLGSARPRPPPPRGRRPAAPAPRPLQVAAVGAPGWRLMEPPRCSLRGSWISRRRSTRGERGRGARAAGPAPCAAGALPPPPRELR